MKDADKSKQQLINELDELRQRVADLETSGIKHEQAKEALKASEAKYQDLYDNAPDMFVSVDAKTAKIIECNQTLATALGYRKEEIIGRPIFYVYHPDCMEAVKKAFRSFVQTGEVHDAELELQRKDGSKLDVSLNATAVHDEQGQVLYSRSIWRDISESKRTEGTLQKAHDELERRVEERTAELAKANQELRGEIAERQRAEAALQESELQIRLLLDSTAEAIYGLDMVGNCTFANAACLQLLGYETTDDLIGNNMHNLIHHTRFDDSPYPMEECRIYKAFKRGKGSHVDDEVLWRADGTSFWAEYWSYPIYRDDQVVGSVVTFLDITDRRRAEEELRKAHEKLVRQEKLAMLGQLAGGVGHELRNPLGVISNAVYYLKMVLPEANETVKEYLETISSEVDRSTIIVSDLLDLSRTRSAERETIDVPELINQSLDRNSPPEEIELVTEIPSDLSPLYVDPRQIGQVLNNLIANAYQAMPEGGKLTIKVEAQEEKVNISITDTGCGISRENMEKLFEPLFTTKAFGIGLGLIVSKNLVDANEGSIEVESEEGKGSTFNVVLPVKEVLS